MTRRKPSAVLARIGAVVWEFSRADWKRFAPDPYALKLRASSARVRFYSYGDEWFRSSASREQYTSADEVTPAELALIRGAVDLTEKRHERPY